MSTDAKFVAEVLRRHDQSTGAAARAERPFAGGGTRRAMRRAFEAEQAALHRAGFENFSDFVAALGRAMELATGSRTTQAPEPPKNDIAVGDRVELAYGAFAVAVERLNGAIELDDDAGAITWPTPTKWVPSSV